MLSHLAFSVSAEDAFLQKKVSRFDLQCLHSVRPASRLVLASPWLQGDIKKSKLC